MTGPVSPRATLMLCDYAVVADGKLFISGGGWAVTNAPTPPSALAILFEVPWDRANSPINFSVELHDVDGQIVTQETDFGPQSVGFGGEFEVGRPPGTQRGTALQVPIAVAIPPLQLPPAGRFEWRLTIDDQPMNERLAFATRPAE